MPTGRARCWSRKRSQRGCKQRQGSGRKSSDGPLGVPGLARQHAEIDADLFQGAFVFAADIGAEDQFRIRRAMQPAIALDLVFKLAGGPAGVAEREDSAGGSIAARY